MDQNNLEKGKIIPWQLVMLMVGFLLGEPILLPIGRIAGHDIWIAFLLSLVEVLFLGLVYTKLALRFKGQTLMEISIVVYGRYLGRLIALGYIWFFFHIGSLVLAVFSHFYKITAYDKTPGVVFVILTVLVCILAVRNGIEVIVRCSQVLVPLIMGVVIMDTLLLLKDWNLSNFLPVLEKPISQILLATQEIVALPLGETVVFLMICPFLNSPNKIAKPFFGGLLFSWLVLLIFAIRVIAVLGPATEIYVYPTLMASRQINIANFITRLEIFTSIGILTMGFLKIITVFYGAVLGTAQS